MLTEILSVEGAALVLRAQELAQDAMAFRCRVEHVLWACVENEPGDEARKLRTACKLAAGRLVRRPEALPPLDDALVRVLEAAGPAGALDRAAIFALACAADLPSRVRMRLKAWQDPEPIEESPPVGVATNGSVGGGAPSLAPALPAWTCLELDDGTSIHVLELTTAGDTVFARSTELSVRARRPLGETVVEIKKLKSAANAQRSLEQRIAHAVKKEFVQVAPVRYALPEESTADRRRRAREQRANERIQRLKGFEDTAVSFFEAWHQMGHDPTLSFHQEGQTHRADWNKIATACVALASRHFDVRFSFLTEVDEEHGVVGPIGERHCADFYESPATVARMAFGKIDQGDGGIDGGFPQWQPSDHVRHEPDDDVSRALRRFVESRA